MVGPQARRISKMRSVGRVERVVGDCGSMAGANCGVGGGIEMGDLTLTVCFIVR